MGLIYRANFTFYLIQYTIPIHTKYICVIHKLTSPTDWDFLMSELIWPNVGNFSSLNLFLGHLYIFKGFFDYILSQSKLKISYFIKYHNVGLSILTMACKEMILFFT